MTVHRRPAGPNLSAMGPGSRPGVDEGEHKVCGPRSLRVPKPALRQRQLSAPGRSHSRRGRPGRPGAKSSRGASGPDAPRDMGGRRVTTVFASEMTLRWRIRHASLRQRFRGSAKIVSAEPESHPQPRRFFVPIRKDERPMRLHRSHPSRRPQSRQPVPHDPARRRHRRPSHRDSPESARVCAEPAGRPGYCAARSRASGAAWSRCRRHGSAEPAGVRLSDRNSRAGSPRTSGG